MVGLMRPDSGSVHVDGEDITDLDEEELVHVRRKVALIFQAGALFDSMSVGDNVAFGLIAQRLLPDEEIDARVAESLRVVGLEGSEETMPSELSGGMRKRVALARSMALQPRCLLYDEPTAGLDPLTGFKVSQLIRETARNDHITSVVVTHDVAAAFYFADRIAFLNRGGIDFIGTPDEARRRPSAALGEFLGAYGEEHAP
jgi:phospholipid/cholesterol/gamma-HCH transport system ATP-binding protein